MKAGKLSWIAGLGLAAAGMLIPGCEPATNGTAPMPPAGGQGDVTLYRDIQFEDIPVPQEYLLITNESHSFQSALFRSGYFVYQGPLEWTIALDFFRSQMPAAGWNLTGTDRGFDFRVFTFRKGPEQIIVTVRQIRNGSRAELQLDNIERNDLLLKGKLPANRK